MPLEWPEVKTGKEKIGGKKKKNTSILLIKNRGGKESIGIRKKIKIKEHGYKKKNRYY